MPSGGKRPGAGRPRKPLSVRLDEGVDGVSHKIPKIIEFPENNQKPKSNTKSKRKPNALPTFLEMKSKEGGGDIPSALEIYEQTLDWVISTGCEKFVMPQLIEDFAFTRRSYLESEYMNNKIAILEDGAKFSAVTISPEQAQFLEVRKFSVNEICRIFRVPPHLIADLECATFCSFK